MERVIEGPTRRELLIGGAAALVAACAGPHKPSEDTIPPGWPLWLVEAKGRRAYLMGETYPRASDWHDPHVEAVVAGLSQLWTETNEIVVGDLQALVVQHGIDAGGSLVGHLDADDRKRLDQACERCNVPLQSMETFRPWLAGVTLENAFYQARGLTHRPAVKVLVAEATAAKVSVFSEFATQNDAIAWFGAMTPTQSLQFLRYILDEVLAPIGDQEATFVDWSRGDFTRATKVVDRIYQSYPELARMILVQRNRNWVPRFERMFAEERPAMAVVGHLHLVGADNVRTLLERAGMTTKRV